MALHKLGYELGQFEVQPAKEWGGHAAAQTVSAVLMAAAAVIALFTQSKDPKLSWALVWVILLVFGLMYGSRVLTHLGVRQAQAARNKAAHSLRADLIRFAKRFFQFTNSGDWRNLRNIVFNACGNNPEKCALICPPDYMRELSPFFLQHFEKRPPENETQFLLAAQELYGFITSYNNNYVLEPIRKMRTKQWLPTATAKPDLVPEQVTWIESLPENWRQNTERQIEDFRERWASFLDDTTQWLDKTSEPFGVKLPSYFERPQKL